MIEEKAVRLKCVGYSKHEIQNIQNGTELINKYMVYDLLGASLCGGTSTVSQGFLC